MFVLIGYLGGVGLVFGAAAGAVLAVTVGLALLIGRMIRLRDRQVPTGPAPRRHTLSPPPEEPATSPTRRIIAPPPRPRDAIGARTDTRELPRARAQ